MKKIISELENMPNFRMIGGVSTDVIKASERELGLIFSNEYRLYLEKYGVVSFSGHEITGICNSPRLNVVTVTKEEHVYNPEVPADLYAVERADIDDVVYWQSASGEIYQSLPGAKTIKIADSLMEYLLSDV